MMRALTRLDREAVSIVYFRADTTATITGISVSWDSGVTWTPLTSTTDPDGAAAYKMTVRGPDADSTDGRALTLGRNRGVARIVDTPEIEVHRFAIDVM